MSAILDYWPVLLAVAISVAQACAAAHVILRRRDVRASAGWMGLIWLAPVVGVVLYTLFGVNRIRRKAPSLLPTKGDYGDWIPKGGDEEGQLRAHLGEQWRHLARLVPLGRRVTGRPLLPGCSVEPLLERGVRVFESPPPFDHSKVMIVDACWILLGSANWDPRSLQLNFELDVEAYDPGVAARLGEIFRERREASREVALEAVRGRSLPTRLRDGAARLLSPYL